MRIVTADIYIGNTCLPGILRLPDRAGRRPAVIFTNGYAAYREMYDGMAEALCRAGYATLQYDNRGTAGADLGRFLCGTEWLEDAAAAVGYMTSLESVDPARIALAGVSMGGAVTLMQGAADPRVKCLAAMAPVFTGMDLIRERWVQNRGEAAWEAFWQRMLADAARTAQGFPSERLPTEYAAAGLETTPEAEAAERARFPKKAATLPLESILNCCLYVDSCAAVRRLRQPLLLIHGTGDETIPYTHSETLYREAAAVHKALHLLPGAGHVLPEEACEQVTALTLDWFETYL